MLEYRFVVIAHKLLALRSCHILYAYILEIVRAIPAELLAIKLITSASSKAIGG